MPTDVSLNDDHEASEQSPLTAAERRIEILSAAAEVFGERGYGKGSLAEIGDRVGITRAGVLHHFGSKEELLIALLEHYDRLEASEREQNPQSSATGVAEYIVRSVLNRAGYPGIMRSYAVLLASSMTEENPTTQYFRDRIVRHRAEIAEAVKEEVKPKIISDEEAERVASAITAFLDGLRMHWVFDTNQVDIPVVVGHTVDALINEVR